MTDSPVINKVIPKLCCAYTIHKGMPKQNEWVSNSPLILCGLAFCDNLQVGQIRSGRVLASCSIYCVKQVSPFLESSKLVRAYVYEFVSV